MTELEPTRTYSNLTATKRLRAMLDERGVEWNATVGANGTIWTHWDAFNGHRVHAMDNEDGTVEIFGQWDVTPEQAIAATLGATDAKPTQTESSGKLTADDVRDLIERHSDASGGNGRDFHNGAYVAIADELNSKLGSCNCSNSERTETCKADKLCDGYLYYTGYWCRGCDERFAYRPIGGKDRGASPKFCPNCGARIVDPTTNDVDAEVDDG